MVYFCTIHSFHRAPAREGAPGREAGEKDLHLGNAGFIHTQLFQKPPRVLRGHTSRAWKVFLSSGGKKKKKKDTEQEPRQDLLTSAVDFVSQLPSIKLEATAI